MPNGQRQLNVENLSCTLSGTRILTDISFRVTPGEYLAIVGPNGAGKTTLLKCLNRIHSATATAIRYGETDLTRWTQRQLARLFGYVPQAGGYNLTFQVDEFVLMSRYPCHPALSAPGEQDWRIVRRMLELVGMSEYARRSLATLSGGERQRVFIAAALAQETPILLLDEPTTFLDPQCQHEVNSLLQKLNREQGTTLIVVSHDVNASALHADRILALKKGQTVFLGSPGDFMRNEILREVFGTDFLTVDHPQTQMPMIVPRRDVEA